MTRRTESERAGDSMDPGKISTSRNGVCKYMSVHRRPRYQYMRQFIVMSKFSRSNSLAILELCIAGGAEWGGLFCQQMPATQRI